MPGLHIQDNEVPGVGSFATLLGDLLAQAASVKSSASIEPPLNKSDFVDLAPRLSSFFSSLQSLEVDGTSESNDQKRLRQNAIIETAVRDLFSNLIVRSPLSVA
jgi:THO complex subunit 1